MIAPQDPTAMFLVQEEEYAPQIVLMTLAALLGNHVLSLQANVLEILVQILLHVLTLLVLNRLSVIQVQVQVVFALLAHQLLDSRTHAKLPNSVQLVQPDKMPMRRVLAMQVNASQATYHVLTSVNHAMRLTASAKPFLAQLLHNALILTCVVQMDSVACVP
jgi:hypothetical protein